VQIVQHIQDLYFAGPVKSVPAFGFQRCGAVRGKSFEIREGSGLERRRRGFSQRLDGGTNAATLAGDLLVRFSGNALLVLAGAAGGEEQVRVRIDESGQDYAPAEIEFFGAARLRKLLDPAARPDGRDSVAPYENRAVADDSKLVKSAAPARNRAPQREKLRTPGDEKIGHGDLQDGNSPSVKTPKF
jgi:hypothetical protein